MRRIEFELDLEFECEEYTRVMVPVLAIARDELDLRDYARHFAARIFGSVPKSKTVTVGAHFLIVDFHDEPSRGELSVMGRSYSDHPDFGPYKRFNGERWIGDSETGGAFQFLKSVPAQELKRRFDDYGDNHQVIELQRN